MAGLPLPSMLDAAGDALKVVGPIIKNSKAGQLIGNLLSKNKKTFKPSNKIKLDDVHSYYNDINRGVGYIKPKKGKGSYRRKNKYNLYE